MYSRVRSVSSWGYSKLTLGGDGQYCIVIGIATLSHCIEGIDGEVVGGDRLQASDSEGCYSGRKDIHVQKTGRLIPAVSVNQKALSSTIFWLWMGAILTPTSFSAISPYAKSLPQTTIEAGDPLQSDRVVGDADLAKW